MGLFRKKTVADPTFGQLKHFSSGNGKEFLHGNALFAPDKRSIGVMVRCGLSGPTEKQREFYTTFQRNYGYYISKLKPLVEEEFRNRKEDIVIVDFDKEFTLEHLEIPNMEAKPLTWEVSFTTVHDANHDVTVTFTGDEPTAVLIDG